MYIETISAAGWVKRQFSTLNLGDKRLNRRAKVMAFSFARNVGKSIPNVYAEDPAGQEAAYRFIRNPRVSPEELIRSGGEGTALAMRPESTILALCDSTTLEFSHVNAAAEFGDLGGAKSSRKRGAWVHSILAIEEKTKLPVGLLHQNIWTRKVSDRGISKQRFHRPYENKESYKWEEGILASENAINEALGEKSRPKVIYVCDREADIFELFQSLASKDISFVIRAAQNRRIEEGGVLFEYLDQLAVLGTRKVAVEARGGRPVRNAELTISAGTVQIKVPKNHPQGASSLSVQVVVAEEKTPPESMPPLYWVILTTEPTDSLENANRILNIYEKRWLIEDFHKAWKSGCKVESLRLATIDSLLKVVVLLAHTAVFLLYIRELAAQDAPKVHAKQILTPLEYQLLLLRLKSSTHKLARTPEKDRNVRWAYHVIGRMGGWHDSRHTGRVGWQAFWEGWEKLQELVDAFHLFEQMKKM